MKDRRNNRNALLVDHDRKLRRTLCKNLENLGFSCTAAKSGREALDILQRAEFRLVVADWKISVMEGAELLSRIRSTHYARYVYVILTATEADKSEATGRLERGADDYLIKPFDPAEMTARANIARRILRLEDGQKRDHLKLLRAQKMASVGQLAAGVAHEINTPTGFVSSNLGTLNEYQRELKGLIDLYRDVMRGIRNTDDGTALSATVAKGVGLVDSLESKLDLDFLLNDMSDVIGECRTGTERIGEIVDNLTGFSNPLKSPFQQVNLNDCIDATLKVIAEDLPAGVELQYRSGKIPPIPGSPGHLNIALLNILTNAIQAVGDKGRVTIETSQLRDRVIVLITDTGPGMSEELVSRIFDPFFTTREPGSGRGLGLNVAYNILEEHGGTLDVNSTAGEGTIFAIQIPAESAKQSNAEQFAYREVPDE